MSARSTARTLVFLAAWAIGLVQSIWLTQGSTHRPDHYADLARYAPLHLMLGNDLRAGFHTDLTRRRRIHARHFRAQYGAMPTILQPLYTEEQAIQQARARVRGDGAYRLVYEYRKRANLRRFEARLQDVSELHLCALTQHAVADKVLLFEFLSCQSG